MNEIINSPKLKFIPLGGNGLVTKNMFLYEYNNNILIVDCGMGFPDQGMHGIDLIIPDISYLRDKKHMIKGIVLTHGHEDHIGGLPYLIKDLASIPIYSMKLTIGLLRAKLRENNALKYANLNVINEGQKINLGSFVVEPVKVSHSIPDSVGYAITTPVGTIFHTGDYKFDPTPLDGKPTDVARLGALGNQGILALMTDCLRSEKPGRTLSERMIENSFEEEFKKATGRILITTFSSNISRIQQAINVSVRYDRKVAVLGRSMENNILTARELGYLTMPKKTLIKMDEIKNYPPEKLTLLVSGAQGQADSALVRVTSGDHQFVSIKSGDLVIFSSDPIPGNQDAVHALIDDLAAQGADIRYSDITSEFHVSGHGAQEELLYMVSLTKPRFLVPISGMYRQMRQFASLNEKNGFKKENIVIMEEGDVLELDKEEVKRNGKVETSDILVDGLGVGDVGEVVLRDRRVLAEEGVVLVVVVIDRRLNKLIVEPDIVSRGFIYVKGANQLINDSKMEVKKIIDEAKVKDWRLIKNKIVENLERLLFNKTQRRPMVLPVVIEI